MKRSFLLCLTLLMLASCGHFRSGHYVKMGNEGLSQFCDFHDVSEAEVISSNPSKRFTSGEWIFIPSRVGLIYLFEDKSPTYYSSDVDLHFFKKGPLLWPVPGSTTVSSYFGPRWGRIHYGIDIAGKIGQHIISADKGVVLYAGRERGGYGKYVVVEHSNGLKTIYAHASKIVVKKGDQVARGQVVAYLGNTGRSTGPHLHFEVRRGNKPMNPMAFVRESRSYLVSFRAKKELSY